MAIRKNNIIPKNHFRKYWQKYVKTWFNQAGRAKSRRNARQAKAAKLAPRPIGLLRPAVHPPTVRYNFKLRIGRGFTLDELKKAGISRYEKRVLSLKRHISLNYSFLQKHSIETDLLTCTEIKIFVFSDTRLAPLALPWTTVATTSARNL